MLGNLLKRELGFVQFSTLKATTEAKKAAQQTVSSTCEIEIPEEYADKAFTSLDMDSCGRYLLVGAADSRKRGVNSILIYDTFNLNKERRTTSKCVGSAIIPINDNFIPFVTYCQWHPDNASLVTSQLEGPIYFWDANNLEKPVSAFHSNMGKTRFSSTNVNSSFNFKAHHLNNAKTTLVAGVTVDGNCFIIDMRIGAPIMIIPNGRQRLKFSIPRWHPEGFVITVGQNSDTLTDWDIRNPSKLFKFYDKVSKDVKSYDYHVPLVSSIKYSKCGRHIFSDSQTNRIIQWESACDKTAPVKIYSCSDSKMSLNMCYQSSFDISHTTPTTIFKPVKSSKIRIFNAQTGCFKDEGGLFKDGISFCWDNIYSRGFSGGVGEINAWTAERDLDVLYNEEYKQNY